MIVEEVQNGKERAEYGKQILKELSDVLTKEFGKGFSVTNIQQMRSFYLAYEKQQTLSDDFKKISSTPSAEPENAISETSSRNFDLSWSHYLKLMRIDDENERKFYEIEAHKNNWSSEFSNLNLGLIPPLKGGRGDVFQVSNEYLDSCFL